jgi:hypothetical protein
MIIRQGEWESGRENGNPARRMGIRQGEWESGRENGNPAGRMSRSLSLLISATFSRILISLFIILLMNKK